MANTTSDNTIDLVIFSNSDLKFKLEMSAMFIPGLLIGSWLQGPVSFLAQTPFGTR